MRSNPVPWAFGSLASIPIPSRELEESGHRRVELVVGHAERVGVALLDVLGPRPGEAVGLEFEHDGGKPGADGPGLDGMTELVGEDDAHGEASELVEERRDQRVLVPGDQVLVRAVEGVVGDLRVEETSVRSTRHRVRIGSVREEAALNGLVRRAVHRVERASPEGVDRRKRGIGDLARIELGRIGIVEPSLCIDLGAGQGIGVELFDGAARQQHGRDEEDGAAQSGAGEV